jgi:AraC-like DNA-binding protein
MVCTIFPDANDTLDIAFNTLTSKNDLLCLPVRLAPIDYLLQLRMAIAKDAFLFTEKRPSEVAFLCGYKSVAAFSTAFRRIVGSSPGAYAKGRSALTI